MQLQQSDLAHRIARVETINRRLSLALGGLIVAMAGLVLCGAKRASAPADVVTAKRFVLVDNQGNTLATLERDAEKACGLRIKGDKATGDIWLGVGDPDDGLAFGSLRIGEVFVSSYGTGGGINIGNEIRIACESFRGRRTANIRVKDPHNQACAVLGAFDSKVERTGVVEQRPVSSLVLLGAQGERIFAAP